MKHTPSARVPQVNSFWQEVTLGGGMDSLILRRPLSVSDKFATFFILLVLSVLWHPNNGYIGVAGAADGRPTTQFQVSEDVAKTRGNHNLGFGVYFQRIYWTSHFYTPNALGSLNPLDARCFLRGWRGSGLSNCRFDSTDAIVCCTLLAAHALL